jgi:hypothetical protein
MYSVKQNREFGFRDSPDGMREVGFELGNSLGVARPLQLSLRGSARPVSKTLH